MSEDGFKFKTKGLGVHINSIGATIPLVLQATLTSAVLIAAVRSSNLKKRWLAGETKFQVIDLNIKIQAFLVFFSNLFYAIVRTGDGMLGFNGTERGREGAIVNFYLSALLVPGVTLATVTRMHRRLDAATVVNEKAFEEKSGIVEAKTVHGQSIKVHWSDVDSKAQLLLRAQAVKIYEDVTESGVETSVKEIEDKLFEHFTPARVFAAGMVGKRADEATWMDLLGSLKNMDTSGKRRFFAQSVIILISLVLLVYTYRISAKNTTFDKILFSATNFFYWQASNFVGLWYEKWALSISSGRVLSPKEEILKWASWTFVQVTLLAFPIISIFRGQFGGHILYVQLLKPVILLGAVHEFVLNEAYIASQRRDAEAFKVPSWTEIAAMLKRDEIQRNSLDSAGSNSVGGDEFRGEDGDA